MNTDKQINAMVVVLFITLIVVGLYAIWDPFRAESAEKSQLDETAERAAITFTQNCRLCHGDAGQGGSGNSGRLGSAAQLDKPELRGIDSGAFDRAAFDETFKHIFNTISCGRLGTQMPSWGVENGGTLNEEQMRQLTVLITGGDGKLEQFHEEGFWEIVQEHADEVDAETTQGATLNMPGDTLSVDATELFVSDAGPFNLGQYIRIKNVEGDGEERMRILPHALEVTRGAQSTQPADHEVGAAVLDANGAPILDRFSETEQALIEAMDDESVLVVVADPTVFAAGDVIQIDNERLEVSEIVRGLPTTNQLVAREIGREPKTVLVSGADGLSEGMTVRIGSELMEITEIRDDGDPGVTLVDAASASTDRIAVSKPSFFAENYVLRAGDELIRVIRAVETEQTLGETIGRAQTSFTISGAAGIEPGMVIRLGDELIRVTEILEPARIRFERGQPLAEGEEPSEATAHDAGTEFLAVVQEAVPEGETPPPPTFEPTEVTFDNAIDANEGEVRVNTTGAISAGSLYQIDDELVSVTEVLPARIRVERAVDGTELASHGRRETIYDDSLLEVERGYGGTTAAAHDPGEVVFMTEIRVNREQGGTKVQDQSKNAEIFLGNSLLVQRGVKDTEASEHENDEIVYDFPPAPDNPPTLQPPICGQTATGSGVTERPTPLPNSTPVDVELSEFEVVVDPSSVAAGLLSFIVENAGDLPHNLHVIQTDLPEDQLPTTAADEVDLAQVIDERSTETIGAGGFAPTLISELSAGRYVLICNVPTHYSSGMHTVFTVQ
jgi:mono/diheme cytochrome c family protein